MKFQSLMLILPLAIVAGSSVASADTIGGLGSSCATCQGAAYTLSYSGSPIASTKTTQTFQITFDVNDSFYIGKGSFLNSVAIKVAPSRDVLGASLISAPSEFSDSVSRGLGGHGCKGNGSAFLCVEASGDGASIHGGSYDFVYDVTVKTGTLFTNLDQDSVKALYVNSKGKKAGVLMSERITLGTTTTATPEPSSYLMMTSGLFGVGLFLKRRKSANKA